VAKFGAISDLFGGGPSSTHNYPAKSRGNLIKLKKVPNEFWKISNSVVASKKAFGSLRKSLRAIQYLDLSSNHAYTPGFLGFMGSKYRIGLKLFLRLPNAFCEATTKFEIFQNLFGTFFSLIEFPHDFTG
jgi:hypothetical protein